MKNGISDEELAGLSDTERAALEDGDDDQDELNEIVKGDADADTDGDDKGNDDKGDDAGTAAADAGKTDADDLAAGADKTQGGKDDGKEKPAASDAAADAAAAATAAGKPDDAGQEPFVSRYVAPAVEKYDEQIAALNTELTEATAKFKAGEIELEDFTATQHAIQQKREDLLGKRIKAEVSAESNEQLNAQRWEWEVDRFKREVRKAEGIDYDKPENKKLLSQLDTAVKVLANDEDNKDKPSEWFLQEAHEYVKVRNKLGVAAKKEDAADDKDKKPAARKPDLKSVPKTLGGLPAAGDVSTGDDDGEFAHLDKLEGIELEAAVAKMSPAQQDKWARSAA